MKQKRILIWSVIVLLALVAARPGPMATKKMLVTGELAWAPVSLCGPYQYYVGTACGGPIWLDWAGWPSDGHWQFLEVEASGRLHVDGGCRVLGVEEIVICWPDPMGKSRGDKGD